MVDKISGMIKKIRELAEKFGINLIYLFGSQAEIGEKYLKGELTTPEIFSDLDVAVSFKNPPENSIKIYGELYVEISEIFDPFYIDLVFIHELNSLFQYEIIKGIRIYEQDEETAEVFEEMVMKKAADLMPIKKIMEREIMEAIENGYFEFKYQPGS